MSSGDVPPPPPLPEKAVHVVPGVEAVKKAPVKKTPPPSGGFGVGL